MSKYKKICQLLQSVVCWCLSFLVKRRHDSIAIGSWCGERYADNSRYLIEYLDRQYPNYKLYWIGSDYVRNEVLSHTNNVTFLEMNRFRTNLKLLRCKYFFFTQMHQADISMSNVYRKAVMCYMHHGMPIKKWGADGLNQMDEKKNVIYELIDTINASNKHYDYFVTSSEKHALTNCTSLSFRGCTPDKNIKTGTPRNDMLIHYCVDSAKHYKEFYNQFFDIGKAKKVILYLPTYRRVSKDIFSFSRITTSEKCALNGVLTKYNAVLIEKRHCAEKQTSSIIDTERVKFADSKMNIQEMMLFTDYLISDYSGAYLDFIMLDRPVIHFAYDYEYYKNTDSGLYYDIEDFSAGRVVTTFNDMLDEIEKLASGMDCYKDKRRLVADTYMEYEKGNASEQIINCVVKPDHQCSEVKA